MPRKKTKFRLIITSAYSYVRNEKTVNVGQGVRIIGPNGRYVKIQEHKKLLTNKDKKSFTQFKRNTHAVKFAYKDPYATDKTMTDGLVDPSYNGRPQKKEVKGGKTRLIDDLTSMKDKSGKSVYTRAQANEIVSKNIFTSYRIWFSAWVHVLDEHGNIIDSSFAHVDSQVLSDLSNTNPLLNYWKAEGDVPLSQMRKLANSTRSHYRNLLSEWVVKGRMKAKHKGRYDVIIQTNSATYKVVSQSYTKATGSDGFLKSIVVEPFLPEYEHSAR